MRHSHSRRRIHWNLHRGGLVLRGWPNRVADMGYPAIACLTDCRFVVNDRARLAIADGGPRSVHAWIEGTLCDCHEARAGLAVRYNAKRDPGFVDVAGKVLSGARHVLVRAVGVGKGAGYEVLADGAY